MISRVSLFICWMLLTYLIDFVYIQPQYIRLDGLGMDFFFFGGGEEEGERISEALLEGSMGHIIYWNYYSGSQLKRIFPVVWPLRREEEWIGSRCLVCSCWYYLIRFQAELKLSYKLSDRVLALS